MNGGLVLALLAVLMAVLTTVAACQQIQASQVAKIELTKRDIIVSFPSKPLRLLGLHQA